MVDAKERRRYIRTETPIPALIRIKNNGVIEEIRGESKNLSATGIMIELEKKLSLGTSIELGITPAGTPNPIHMTAKVIRSEKIEGKDLYSTGIEFVKIEEDNKNTFLKFLCDTIYKMS